MSQKKKQLPFGLAVEGQAAVDRDRFGAGDASHAAAAGGGSLSDYQCLITQSAARLALFEYLTPIDSRTEPDAIIEAIWTHASVCIETNENFFGSYGFVRKEEALGLPVAAFLPRTAHHERLFRDWAKNGFRLRDFELSFRDSRGRDLVLQTSVYSVITDGRIRKLWLVQHNITELSMTVDALQRAEAHYRTLVERPGFILVRFRPAGNLLYVSPALTEILGAKPSESYRSLAMLRSLVHPEDAEHYDSISAGLRSGTADVIEREFRVFCSDGTYHWFFERILPNVSASGTVEYYDAILLDIEERKRLEAEVHHAQRMDVIGSVAGGIAHDFNNHLTAILGQIALVSEELEPSHPSRENLEAAEQAAIACSEMTRELLMFSRKSEPQRTPLPLASVMEAMNQLVKATLPANITFLIQHEDAECGVFANVAQLQQIIMNLIVNARDAMPGGGVLRLQTRRIILRADRARQWYPEAKPGEYVEFIVTDSGEGIPPEHLPRLFEPFFTTKAPGKGTGLGLSSVYSIIKNHSGAITVRSERGQGSTFSFILPYCQVGEQKPQSGSQPKAAGGSECILVIDDDPMVRGMLRAALRAQGYHIREASDGAEGLATLNRHADEIGLLILDEMMPKLAGHQVIRELKPRWPELPVLFSSGHASDEILSRVNFNSRIRFLPKPFTMSELYQHVRELLDLRNRAVQ